MSRVDKLAEVTSIRELAVGAAAGRARLAELLEDPEAEVRAAAAAAVESYPDDRALVARALRLARDDGSAEVRRGADLALGRIVREGDLAGVEGPGFTPEEGSCEPDAALHAEVREHLLGALRDGRSEGERLAAMEALACLADRPEVVAAIERAGGGYAASRAAALRAMGMSGDAARWRGAVLGALGAREAEVSLAAVRAAGELRLTEAIEPLATLLAAPGSSARAAARAAEALGRLGGAAAARALREAAGSASDEDVRQAVRDALEELEVLGAIDDELGAA